MNNALHKDLIGISAIILAVLLILKILVVI